MEYEKTEKGLLLKGNLSLREIDLFVEIIQGQFLENDSTIELDMSEVQGIDTAILQVLVSARKSARVQKRNLAVTKTNKTVREILNLTGLSTVLQAEPAKT